VGRLRREARTAPSRRLKLGDLRVTYDVDDDQQTVDIYLVGQIPPARRS
jgi:mRNA-degrading endonuclease RelE of RelBE toxin-antitoxin system